MLYFEDFPPGDVRESPPRAVTREEIVAFAREFDPQPFHLEENAARRSIYGGLLASGWHTCAIHMRLMWDTFLRDTASLGSPGVDEIRWVKPVRPGDTLYSIAWRFGLDHRDLARANGIDAPYTIVVGQRIRLSAPSPPRWAWWPGRRRCGGWRAR